MLDPILAKIFGTKNEREIKTLRPIIAAINDLEPGLLQLPDAELAQKTQDLKQRVANGEPLADLLIETFAVYRKP
jgi:preprotein translocase subunit SecA